MYKTWKHNLAVFLLFLPIWAFAQTKPIAILLNVNGAISPATYGYIQQGLVQAVQQHAELIILTLDTPGGLDKAMRDIIKDIIASPVPVVAYVSPGGARAASAGTFIVYACHIAAMAPATNIGAASPVSINISPLSDPIKNMKPTVSTVKAKITNDAIAYIRSLAQLRNRNVEWAEQAVRAGASISAQEALSLQVIDVIAKDVPELLKNIHGKKVMVQGKERLLNTAGLTVITMEPDWHARLLAVITDPNVAYVLMLIGIYGLFFEFLNPGFVLPGVAGAIALLLALYAFQLLPISYTGTALIFLGIAFMVAELFMPSFGALGIGGVIAFLAGSVMLFNPEVGGYGIALSLIISMALINAIFFFAVIGMAVRARRRAIVSGHEALLNETGEVISDFEGTGWVRIRGERWRAQSSIPLKKGQKIRVVKIDGLTLVVAK